MHTTGELALLLLLPLLLCRDCCLTIGYALYCGVCCCCLLVKLVVDTA